MLNRNCFSINTYVDLEELIKIKKNKKKILVVFIRNYLIKGLGIDWLSTLIKLIKKNYSDQNIKIYVDAGSDYGLSTLIVRENIDYLKLKSNKVIMKKINQIANQNKVLLNPPFHIIDLSKLKNFKNLRV